MSGEAVSRARHAADSAKMQPVTEPERIAYCGSTALFDLALGDDSAAEKVLERLDRDDRDELLDHLDRLRSLLQ